MLLPISFLREGERVCRQARGEGGASEAPSITSKPLLSMATKITKNDLITISIFRT